MKKYLNEDLFKIIISIVFALISLIINNHFFKLIFLVMSYFIISYEMYIEAYHNIKDGEIFDENVLMIIATLGAFVIKSYEEAVLVMILFQIGEYLSDLAVNKSKESITKLMDLRVEKIRLIIADEEKEVKVEKAKIDDIFIVLPGEKIPLDGVIVAGNSYLDTSSLTGESQLRKVNKNDDVLSGTINKDGVLKIKATTTYKTTTAKKIIDLIENSNEKKSDTETFITRFARIYTPTVVFIALLLVIIPTFLGQDFHSWLYRALVFLVTSCPCALVISVPLGYFCGIGKASLEKILIKGSKELDNLNNIDYIILDKTGTITEGVFKVSEVNTKMPKEEFLKLVASAEEKSIHPIATAIKESNKNKLYEVSNYKEIAGKGISCKVDNKTILVGNKKLLKDNNVEVEESSSIGTIIYVTIDNKYAGNIVISDKIKKSSYKVNELEKVINKNLVILSGDNTEITKDVAKKVGVEESYGNLLPTDKVDYVKKYQKEGRVLFVGDGINDAPVIRMADIGVSMGNIGSDASIEASDVVLMQDNLLHLKKAINIAKLTKRKVTESIIFALTIKFIILLLSLFGLTTILLAVFADVGVTLLVIFNVLTIFFRKID